MKFQIIGCNIIVTQENEKVLLVLQPKIHYAHLELPQARDLGMSLIQMADFIAQEQRRKQMQPKPKRMHPRRKKC